MAARLLMVAALPLLLAAWPDSEKDVSSVLNRRSFWAFQPVERAEVPAFSDAWVRNPVDAFILEALRAKGLTPSDPLDRARLMRRVTLDLTGLPPDPAAVQAFMRDTSPDAYERLVERLLASPAYGERWALRWLDVVRYADTNGFEGDRDRVHAWRYRDYVARSFNQDKPYDRFVKEQVAGDEIYSGDRDALIATGFHRAGPEHIVGGMVDKEEQRQEVLTEMAAGVGNVFLGLTVGCARCHNHKFDPILQSDYYRIQAIFAATEGRNVDIATPEEKTAHKLAEEEHKARLAPVKAQIDEIEKPFRERLEAAKRALLAPHYAAVLEVPKDRRDEEQKRLAKEAESQIRVPWNELVDALPQDQRERRAALRRQMHEIELHRPAPLPAVYAAVNSGAAHPTHVLKIGDFKHKLGEVGPGVPIVVAAGFRIPEEATGRRSALAEWLTDPDHPLTARVMVNRIWQFRMGAGIVGTPNDFGRLGERPSNRKLLDWLAAEFVARNWSVKEIDRLIVLSSTYRQSAAEDAAKAKIDPANRLYWRMNRKRMEAETLRDSVLAVSGSLNPKIGGPPVRVPIEPEIYDLLFTEGEPDNLWPVTPDTSEHKRRSIYLLNKRSVRLPMLAAFDQPDTITSCAQRNVSTHPLQALALFNSSFAHDEAQAFARRLETACGADRDCAVRQAFWLALGRGATEQELTLTADFLRQSPLSDFTLALLNRHEFVYVP
ncbi:MAG: DUF1553 domain-containing protein [Bryobacterales bacterium]|nr:DUF1553 domain-containing protein [Bryobacterales bacterium]